MINVGSSTIVPLPHLRDVAPTTAPAAHSISPSGGDNGQGNQWPLLQVLRHLTVASGSRQTTALPAVASTIAQEWASSLLAGLKLGVECL